MVKAVPGIFFMVRIPIHKDRFVRSFFTLKVHHPINQWQIGGVGWWFGFPGFPYERDCYLGAPRFESQTTGPQTTNSIS